MSQSICNICQYSDSRSSECQILLFTISHSREIRLGKLSLLKTPLDNFMPRRLTKFSKSKLENGLFTNFISIVRVLELCSIAYFVVDPVRPPFLVFRDAFSSDNSSFWPGSDEWRRHHRIHWMSHFPIPPWWWSSDLDYLKSIEDITLLLCWQQMLIVYAIKWSILFCGIREPPAWTPRLKLLSTPMLPNAFKPPVAKPGITFEATFVAIGTTFGKVLAPNAAVSRFVGYQFLQF